MRSVVHWLLRRGGLYLLLVLAVAAAPFVVAAIRDQDLSRALMSPHDVSQGLEGLRKAGISGLRNRQKEIQAYSASAIEARLSAARAQLAKVESQLDGSMGWLASLNPEAVLRRKQLEISRLSLKGEISLLEAAGKRRSIPSELIFAPTEAFLARLKQGCETANGELARFRQRSLLDRSFRNLLQEEQKWQAEAESACREYRTRAAERSAALAKARGIQTELAKAEAAYDQAAEEAVESIARIQTDISPTLRSILLQAALLLAAIIATPYLIRLLFYFVLAPLAGRRPVVRFPGSGDTGAVPVCLQPSATSAPIRLEAGEELLVRQRFLQSTSSQGSKATRALLDWRHPLSSLASGLAFLTCVRGAGEVTTVSAVHDPFAEVTVLGLPAGAACVLQPRALVAVVQPTGRPVRITSHWRLGSLHAWLTLQLRFLMFHGPAKLVVKGGRGVRTEPAERGRVFGQEQLIGFSPDLAYSVTRTETFWPYFLGLERLLKDKVEAGRGVLIIEEAPVTSGGRSHPARGLEGAADVLLKAVGL